MIRISVTSKLDGVRSWSLVARETCPGAIGADGSLVPACAGCYAVGGNYRYPNVKNPRMENREDWKRDEWVADMVAELRNDRFFRWFDSGDMYAIGLAEKIFEVMQATPHVQHWLPTRMHKFPKFADVLARMQSLPNVMVRPSSDSVTGEYVAGVHGSTIIPPSGIDVLPPSVTLCHAAKNDGKCGGCRACYSKDVAGRSMAKVVREQLAA
jgi:hypothetical protein